MTLGEIIKKYREKNRISIRDFENQSGISRGYLSMLEKNEHPRTKKPIAPSIEIIKQAAKAMNISFDQIFNMMDGQEISLEVTKEIQDKKLTLTPLEKDIILKFRQLTSGERNMFLRSLGIEEKKDEEKMA